MITKGEIDAFVPVSYWLVDVALSGKAERGELPLLTDAPKKDPQLRKRIDALKTWRAEKAADRKVTPSVVLSNALVDDLARDRPATLDALRAQPLAGALFRCRPGVKGRPPFRFAA